ncbi:universal stress protein [Herbaspirillum sp. RV1423]|uniref:universal stress protein n=1 Tax=Herbaspirillum sp. RV1423 TaxID=1443993 RepID=UPI0004AD2C07|nr:universal stress protein [Herbaspirillum sp. RV1423]
MYKHILVPLDGSTTAEQAVHEACSLAQLCKAQVRLLHVLDMATYSNGFEQPEVYISTIRPLALQEAEEMLARHRAMLEAKGIDVDTEIRESLGARVADIIVERAVATEADLIVIGTHGRRGMRRFVMGSDAEQVARTSPVPVLLVKYRVPIKPASEA